MPYLRLDHFAKYFGRVCIFIIFCRKWGHARALIKQKNSGPFEDSWDMLNAYIGGPTYFNVTAVSNSLPFSLFILFYFYFHQNLSSKRVQPTFKSIVYFYYADSSVLAEIG